MPCAFATAYAGNTACPPPSPGMDELDIWLMNRADITWGTAVAKVYPTVTLAGATLAYRWSVHNKGLNFTDEFTENETTGAGSWAPKLNFRLLGFDGATSNAVEKFRGVDVVAVVRAKNGKYLVFGSEAGLRLTANTTGSDADTLGESVTLGGNEEPSKHYQLLVTDAATTRSTLIALES